MKGFRVVADFWVASCTPTGGAYHFRLIDGDFRLLQKIPMPSPMFLQREGDRLWAVLRGEEESSLLCHHLTTHRSVQYPTCGAVACHLAVDGEDAYCANYLGGSLFQAPRRVVCHSGRGKDPKRQASPHPHSVFFTPDKRYLLCCDLGLDTVFVYDRALNEVSSAKTPDGAGPRHLVFSKDGGTVYCLNEMGGSISRFSYRKGRLTHQTTVSLGAGHAGAAIKRQGDRLYATERESGQIITLDTELQVLSRADCHGREPRDFTLLGAFALCANQFSDSLALFRMEQGIPVYLHSLSIPAPLCIIE